MSFDALMIPAAPQPPAAGTHSSQSTDVASFKIDRPAESDDHKQSFLTTLNRVSERKSSKPVSSQKEVAHSAQTHRPKQKSAQSAHTDKGTHQHALQDLSAKAEVTESIPETPLTAEKPAIAVLHDLLLQLLSAEDGALIDEASLDDSDQALPAALNQLIGRLYPEGQAPSAGRVGIGPFEQLQTTISPEANNLAFLRHLINRAIVHPFAAQPPNAQGENASFDFWRTLTAAIPEGAITGGRTEAFSTRVNELIQFLLQPYDSASATSGLETATTETNAPKTAVNIVHAEALSSNESQLMPKITNPAQTSELPAPEMTQPASAEKDNRQTGGVPKNVSLETLLDSGPHKNDGHLQAAKSQSAPKAVETALNSNAAAESLSAKPAADEAINVKGVGPQNEILSFDQSSGKVIQIDGDAKDSGFLASQENLPEHLAKLEHTGRSAESSQRNLASQTLNQIVQKAVLLNNNGQNMVQIDLKPEFLGHIRMQIVTENQLVAVRIMAEIPFVKDMLENNLNQLKAELQAQGLEVDELEVSVAHDSRADDDLYQKAAEARRARASQNNRHSADVAAEEQSQQKPAQGYGRADSAIDFFV